MSKPIDWNKPVQTGDGQAVTIFTTTASGERPVVGRIQGDTNVYRWHSSGKYSVEGADACGADLMNVPEKRVEYFNIYKTNPLGYKHAVAHETREAADKDPGTGRTACVRIEYTEGQFDE